MLLRDVVCTHSAMDSTGTDNDPKLKQGEDGYHQQHLLAHASV